MSRRHVARSLLTGPEQPDDLAGEVTPDQRVAAAPVVDPLACLALPLDPSAPHPAMERGPVAWVGTLLAGVVEAAPGVTMGSVAETSADGVHTWAATASVAEELARRGAEWSEGPGAEALRDRVPVGTVAISRVDGPAARRWPRWSTRARAAGVAATLSVVLPGGPRKRPAVLALHGPDGSAFGSMTVAVARAFAAPLAVAVQTAARVTGLERALESRDVIGQAKGLLMAYHGIDERAAFEQLVTISQHSNVRLAEVATRIVAQRPVRQHGSEEKCRRAPVGGALGQRVDPPAAPAASEEGIVRAGR